MEHTERIELLLQSIASSLQTIAYPKQTKTLGFCDPPSGAMYIFCNRNNGGNWYSLDENSKPVVIEHKAIEGYLRQLTFEKVERRRDEVSKLRIVIEADRRYTLECGSSTQFSKGFLSAIALLTPEAIAQQTIIIAPSPSTESEEVLFCNVYIGGQRIHAPYDSQTDFKVVARTACEMVKIATEKSNAQ
jgi:hypothetical protein